MAEWTMRFDRKNFDLTDYVPLDGVFTEPFHFYVKLRFTYHSEIYHTDNDHTVEVSGDITGYDPRHNHPTYPVVCCYMGKEIGGVEPCGPVIWAGGGAGDYTVTNIQGKDTDNITAIETPITTANYGQSFNGYYTSNGQITIESCNIPVIVAHADTDIYGDYLWYMGNPDTDLNINQYDPDSNQITEDILSKAVNWDNDE